MTTIDINGTHLNYRLEGAAGAPVVGLCHSLGTSLALWDRQIESLGTSFHILRYDLRGHGASGISPAPYSVADLAADFIGLLDALGIECVHFCGVSLGGLIGQWLGARAPDRIGRLVLANTAAKIGTADVWDARITSVRSAGIASVADGAIERWFTAPFVEREPDVVEAFREMLLDTPREGYLASCAAIRDADQRPLAPAIARPTLVVAGQHDAVTTPDDAAWLCRNIPGATMTTLPAAHLANVEAAAEWNIAVQAFLLDHGGLA